MKKLIVLTTSRADFGLLLPVIRRLMDEPDIKVFVVASGSHLSSEFGLTYREVESNNIKIDKKIEILLSADTPSAISKSMGLALISFSEYFEEIKPDALLVLGDRYETLAICCAAMNACIPIFHLYGGETTEGAVDESIRHSITKMSMFHFTATEEFRKRVIQLGEAPERVFCVGAMGVENALNNKAVTMAELSKIIGKDDLSNLVVCTFHPVTLETHTSECQIREILSAIEQYPQFFFLWTKANSDAGGRIINYLISQYTLTHDNAILMDSLGVNLYLSCLKYARFVLGNSSSGLAEVPSFGIPTINIGDRQKGRIRAPSVIDCLPQKSEIMHAIKIAMSDSIQKIAKKRINPYGDGNTSSVIVRLISNLLANDISVKKSFFDIDFKEVI